MIFTCPECETRLRGDKPGTVVACHICSNPVVVPAPPEERSSAASGLPSAPVPATRPQRSPWATAGIVLAIVAAAHVGLFLLLTMEARSQRSELEDAFGAGALAAAAPPAAPPEGGGTPEEVAAALRPWNRANELWLAAKEHERHDKHVTMLRTGFLFSFLVQVCITGWILAKVAGRRRPAPA